MPESTLFVVFQSLSHVRLFATPWTVTQQAPLSTGCAGQKYWSGLPCPPPGDLPDSGIEPMSFMPLSLASGFFTTSTTWEARISHLHNLKFYLLFGPS